MILYKAEVQKKHPNAFCKIEPIQDKFGATLYLYSVYLEKGEEAFMRAFTCHQSWMFAYENTLEN